MDLNLDAENVNELRDLEIDDDVDKDVINKLQDETDDIAQDGNDNIKDTGQQLANQVENFAQK